MTTVVTAQPNSLLGLPVFLTAYDPSDLPGSSLDPLGFERGYLHLADKLLPGLTNVADRPRYFSVLCAGAFLADVGLNDPPRLQYQRRLDCILRFERFWALANVFASEQADEGALPVSGIRGVTYATGTVESLLRNKVRRVDSDFKMLSRQVPYGVVGIYGAVADGMHFIDRKTFTLTPDLGERLAEGFLDDSDVPRSLIKAIREDGTVPLQKLTEWGQRTHVAGEVLPVEATCLHEALNRNPVRARMAEVLALNPSEESGDSELRRLSRALPALSTDSTNQDLSEAVTAILAYEDCYRIVMLGFERLLWLCRNLTAASISPTDLQSDGVLTLACDLLPAAAREFAQALDLSQTELFRTDLQRLEDTRRFVERAASACGSNESLTRELMTRHDDVQRGKFDRGRRKMPWLETTGDRISLTMTRVGGLNREATSPTNIAPHPYRLSSADALIAAAEGS
jgi:hypothetical protein